MKSLTDPRLDDDIRAALLHADGKDQLSVVAAVTGIAGGEDKLREIMQSEEPLAIMDRGMLGLHLLT